MSVATRQRATAALARLRKLALERADRPAAALPLPWAGALHCGQSRLAVRSPPRQGRRCCSAFVGATPGSLVVGPSGSGKVVADPCRGVARAIRQRPRRSGIVQRGGNAGHGAADHRRCARCPELGGELDHYCDLARNASDVQLEHVRTQLRAVSVPDGRRRIVVLDPLEELRRERRRGVARSCSPCSPACGACRGAR